MTVLHCHEVVAGVHWAPTTYSHHQDVKKYRAYSQKKLEFQLERDHPQFQSYNGRREEHLGSPGIKVAFKKLNEGRDGSSLGGRTALRNNATKLGLGGLRL